jgi:hypothetical protein
MQFLNILSEWGWGFCTRKSYKKVSVIYPGTKIPFQGPKKFSKDDNGFPNKFFYFEFFGLDLSCLSKYLLQLIFSFMNAIVS